MLMTFEEIAWSYLTTLKRRLKDEFSSAKTRSTSSTTALRVGRTFSVSAHESNSSLRDELCIAIVIDYSKEKLRPGQGFELFPRRLRGFFVKPATDKDIPGQARASFL